MKHRCTIVVGMLLMSLIVLEAQAQVRKVARATRMNTSAPLHAMGPAQSPQRSAPYAVPNKFKEFTGSEARTDRPGFADPARQAQAGTRLAASVLQNFDGTSDDDNAALLGFRIVPPDTDGDVGPNHYVQWNNLVAEIFDKNGVSLTGPFPGNQFFQGLGGACETTNDGDPVVRYDEIADRWMVSQFAVDGGPPYYECVAVSTGPDPTGSYHQYEFSFGSDFPDYPKLGVWPDAYYMTTRNFANGSFFTGVQAVAFERDQMLQGLPAQMVIFDIPGGTANDGWLPADLDGPAPPAGAPGIFAGAPNTTGSNEIQLWAFSVDWANPTASSFTQVATLPTDPFDTSISTVPQKKPGENLDALAGFLMFPMQYRNFGTHQTLVLNHTVDAGGNRAGIRWYELRDTGGGWSIYQQGTYAPDDGLHRWVGAISMNGNGDIALGYTVSGKNDFPSIRFTGQTADQSGTGVMNVAETVIVSSGGTQRSSSGRWGDYSAMSVDPADDLTFWHTNEYYAASGSFDFNTRIAAFQLGGGGGGTATSIHVEDVQTGTQGVGQGNKVGTATVTIFDDLGSPYAGATVTGTFSGDYNETVTNGPTASDGTVTLTTTGTAKGKVTFSFCVNDVVGGLPYDPNANADPAFACAAAKGGASVAGVRFASETPDDFALDQNYPNPFNPSTEIAFTLPEGAEVTLKVFDLLGREVTTLVRGYREAGRHQVTFDATELGAGVYLYVIEAGSFTATRRMTLLK